ncbi:MAG: YraN family protein [Acidobacteriia bacterium]|nr:YraN family protein [Terriglobia bacterium]
MGMPAPHLLMGRKGERIACRYLMRLGFDILARRYRARRGEIDLIAFEGTMLAFVEVKTRASREFGDPWEFVDWEKQQSLRLAGEEFIAHYDLGQYTYRFDVVAIVAPGTRDQEVALYRNAF